MSNQRVPKENHFCKIKIYNNKLTSRLPSVFSHFNVSVISLSLKYYKVLPNMCCLKLNNLILCEFLLEMNEYHNNYKINQVLENVEPGKALWQ